MTGPTSLPVKTLAPPIKLPPAKEPGGGARRTAGAAKRTRAGMLREG